MRVSTLSAALAIANVAIAAPAPQQLVASQIVSAQAVQTGPAFNGIAAQTATLIVSVDVSTVATAVSTAAPSGTVQKRDAIVGIENGVDIITGSAVGIVAGVTELAIGIVGTSVGIVSAVAGTAISAVAAADTFLLCWATWGIACPSSATGNSPSGSSGVSVASSIVTAASSTTSVSSAYTPYYPALSTVTPVSTVTTGSSSACPTAIESGTYCGFINPEDPCAPQPDGYGPVPTPDTVSAFYAYKPFHSMASAAPTTISASASATASASSVPQVYQQTFRDLNASSSANSYLGLYTLKTYNAAQCAALCDSTSLCTAFNIYIERDPSVNPTNNDSTAPTVWGYNCPDPASMTSYKCTLWGSNLAANTATNAGQWREQFEVVITASNGYDKTNVTFPATPIGNSTNNSPWSHPRNCGPKAINAPNNWMGSRFFPGPFNPQLCANLAIAQNYENKAASKSKGSHYYQPCNMFNAYYLLKDALPYGTYCALYDIDLAVSYATLAGTTILGDIFEISQSFTWTLATIDSGVC